MHGYTWSTLEQLLGAEDRATLAKALNVQDTEDLAARLADPSRIRAALERLPQPQQVLLKRIWLSGGQIDLDHLHRTDRPDPAVPAALARNGLLVQLRLDYYQHVYALPLEVQQQVAQLFVVPDIAPSGPPVPLAPAPAMPVWSRDLFRLISHCRWNHVPLTQQGEIYKRVQQQMAATLWPDHPVPAPIRLLYLVGFADWAGLLRVDPVRGSVQATTEAAHFWQQPPAERWGRYLDYWLEVVLGAAPLNSVVWDLLIAAGPRGLPVNRLTAYLTDNAGNPAARVRAAVNEVTRAGLTAGLLGQNGKRLFVAPDAYAAWAHAYAVDERPSAVIQPTGDILVSAETAPAALWEAESAVALHRADITWVYRFNRTALERAVTLGLGPADVVARLEAIARTPVPDNVRTEIEDAFRRAGRVGLASGVVVWTGDEATAALIGQALTDLNPLTVGQGVFLLREDQGSAAAQRLYKMGYALKTSVDRYGTPTRYQLADPLPGGQPYHPQVQVQLPRRPPVGHGDSWFVVLESALTTHHPVVVEYQTGGDGRLRRVRAILTQQRGETIYGVALETLAPLTFSLNQVVQAWPVEE
jgi:hypothetical protein